jgi:hypothetical protein
LKPPLGRSRIARMDERRQPEEERRAREHPPIPHPMPPEEMKVEDVRFFVVGHGRSGTTWLEQTLNSHPAILCAGPGMLFGKNLTNFGGRRVLYELLANADGLESWHEGLKDWRGGYSNPWTKSGEFDLDAAQIARATIDALMRRALTESGKRILGDRTPHHISQLWEIHTLYPNAKIVHAVRDGRDVAVSNAVIHLASSKEDWHTAKGKKVPTNLSTEEIEIRDAYFQDRTSFLASGRSLFTEEQIHRWARGWNRIVRRGRRTGRELFGESYFELKYEDHLHRPQTALKAMFGFLETDTSPEIIERTIEENTFKKLSEGRSSGEESSGAFFRKGISGDWKGVFNERDKKIFKEEAGELLVELGYEKDLSW